MSVIVYQRPAGSAASTRLPHLPLDVACSFLILAYRTTAHGAGRSPDSDCGNEAALTEPASEWGGGREARKSVGALLNWAMWDAMGHVWGLINRWPIR